MARHARKAIRIDARAGTEKFDFEVGGKSQSADGTWFRGPSCNFNPTSSNLRSGRAAVDYVLQGWLPPAPVIGQDTRVTAFGSCFAGHIGRYLSERNYRILSADRQSSAHIVRMGEGMVNSFALTEQFRWALEGERYEGDFWHGYEAESFGYSEDERLETRRILMETDVFIITFGLSEIWFDAETGGVFWRAVPERLYDPNRHKFRVASFADNKTNIRKIYDLIRSHRPDANIIFTMSPVPLVATFRPVSCITANSASKALLRAAIDEVYREVQGDGVLHYWPAYEIVLDVFDRRWEKDRRHVKKPILDYVMTLFEHTWCFGQKPKMSLAQAYLRALAAIGDVSMDIGLLVERGDRPGLDQLASDWAEKGGSARRQAKIVRELLAEW